MEVLRNRFNRRGITSFPSPFSLLLRGRTPVHHHHLLLFLISQTRHCSQLLSNTQTNSPSSSIIPDPRKILGHLSYVKESKQSSSKTVNFKKIPVELLPSVALVGRPNVGKSALFNRLIRRREALVVNTPLGHVTRDIREGVGKLGDLCFRVLDSAGLDAENGVVYNCGSILARTASMTQKLLSRTRFAIFMIDGRAGLHPLDMEVGKWLRKNASDTHVILAMNKVESINQEDGSLAAAIAEAHGLGFGEPLAISAEAGLGMAELYETLHPHLTEYMLQTPLDDEVTSEVLPSAKDAELSLQLAIVGRPNVGKSTLVNAILLEDRVLVGPEAGLTRDSIRAKLEYDGRTIYLVDTAGWIRGKDMVKGPASLSVMQSKKNLMRAHIVALVLDAAEIVKARSSMRHAEVVIARQAVEEGRGLVVIVNKMDLLEGKKDSLLCEKVMKAVDKEVQSILPQVSGIPVVYVSALEGKGREEVLKTVIDTYKKWCARLPTARLNRWVIKIMSRHSWKDLAAQPKVKYFTQVKARPPTFIAFTSGSTQLLDTDIRFLRKSLEEDFDIGGVPIRIFQRSVSRKGSNNSKTKISKTRTKSKVGNMMQSDKRIH